MLVIVPTKPRITIKKELSLSNSSLKKVFSKLNKEILSVAPISSELPIIINKKLASPAKKQPSLCPLIRL